MIATAEQPVLQDFIVKVTAIADSRNDEVLDRVLARLSEPEIPTCEHARFWNWYRDDFEILSRRDNYPLTTRLSSLSTAQLELAVAYGALPCGRCKECVAAELSSDDHKLRMIDERERLQQWAYTLDGERFDHAAAERQRAEAAQRKAQHGCDPGKYNPNPYDPRRPQEERPANFESAGLGGWSAGD